jgi:hypothetical protein
LGHYRSFLEFDLSAISADAEITSAYLSLYYNPDSGSNGHEGSNSTVLQRVIDPWEELTLNWNNQPGSTNENGIILPASSLMDQDYTNINVTSLVQDMVNNSSGSHGFMMKQLTEDIYRSMKFASGDFGDPSRHPKLEVCYRMSVSNKDLFFDSITIRPNPFYKSFILQNLKGSYLIYMTDVNGKRVYMEEIENTNGEIEVNHLDDLPAGIYFINAVSASGNYFSKIVKAD